MVLSVSLVIDLIATISAGFTQLANDERNKHLSGEVPGTQPKPRRH